LGFRGASLNNNAQNDVAADTNSGQPGRRYFSRRISMRVFKSTSLAIFLFAAMVGSSLALPQSQEDQSAKQDMKDAGHATKDAAKDTGRATKKTAKKTGHAVKHTTKKATHKTAQKTREGAQKVEDKTNPN
jgi:hypothetical protein